MAKFNKKKLPSRHTSLGADRAPHRSFYYAMGETEKDVAKLLLVLCQLGMKLLLVILL
jgi:hypothetical protein